MMILHFNPGRTGQADLDNRKQLQNCIIIKNSLKKQLNAHVCF